MSQKPNVLFPFDRIVFYSYGDFAKDFYFALFIGIFKTSSNIYDGAFFLKLRLLIVTYFRKNALFWQSCKSTANIHFLLISVFTINFKWDGINKNLWSVNMSNVMNWFPFWCCSFIRIPQVLSVWRDFLPKMVINKVKNWRSNLCNVVGISPSSNWWFQVHLRRCVLTQTIRRDGNQNI